MPVCTRCSRSFKFLDTAQCEPCIDALASAVSKPKSKWPACADCSKCFKFLSSAQCFACKEKESMPPPSLNQSGGPGLLLSQDQNCDIQHAIMNATNPRTHGTVSYYNPFHSQRAKPNKNDVSAMFKLSVFLMLIICSFVIRLHKMSLKIFKAA